MPLQHKALSVSRNQMSLMKQLKLIVTTAVFFLPYCAFAHGEEVLVPVFIQLISILALIIFLLVSKLAVPQKVLLGTTYLLTFGLIILLTWNVPYRENRIVLDLAMTIGPAITTLIAFLFLRFRKRTIAR